MPQRFWAEDDFGGFQRYWKNKRNLEEVRSSVLEQAELEVNVRH